MEAAMAPATRFVELYPERGPFRANLARLLEKTGALGEAEKHFRKLLEVEPENPTVYLWLAEFLARHRPQVRKEALEYAEKALGLAYVLAQHRPESREEALKEARLARDLYGANAADRKRAENLIKKLESKRD
jgi:predicted Zn-dependent protease